MAFHHALTVDLEDWYDALLVRRHVPRHPTSLVVQATLPILELFRRYEVLATFFVVGRIARDEPQLIRRIYDEGHEIAFHGFSHRSLWELSPEEFRRELQSFKHVMKSVVGLNRTEGFRAPMFSLDEQTMWAVELLLEFGYTYDSSIFPVRTPLYGVPRAPLTAYWITPDATRSTAREGLLELPPTTMHLVGQNVPLAGGFYLRLIPKLILLHGLQWVAKRQPLVLYLHPWEMSPLTPRLRLPLRHRFITYYGSSSTEGKLDALLQEFQFQRMDQLARVQGKEDSETPRLCVGEIASASRNGNVSHALFHDVSSTHR